jgi:hypothetical protein
VVNLSFEDIGNLGDFIAAIATIATLAYLAYQIKLNTKSNQASTAIAWFGQESTLAMFIAQHANIYRRGNANLEALNEDEAVVFLQIVTIEIADVWSGMIQHRSGLISEFELATYEIMWKNYIAKPGFRSAWLKIRSEYDKDFCQWVDSISAAPKSEVPPLD